MLSLERLRRRLPLVVFLLLLILLLMLVGFACACLSDHPMQALEPASTASMPALLVLWVWLIAAFATATIVVQRRRPPSGRASPAVLQCFLF